MQYEKKEGDDLKILYDGVPYIAQKRAMSCWYACAKMVLAFSRPDNAKIKNFIVVENTEKKQAVEALLIKSQPLISKEQADNIGATEKEWPLIAEAFGFAKLSQDEVKDAGSSFDKLVELLRKYGPLWSAGRFYQGGNTKAGHVIVLTGAVVRPVLKKATNHVIFHDPAPDNVGGGPSSIKQYDSYFKSRGSDKNGLFTWDETEGEAPLMYKPKK